MYYLISFNITPGPPPTPTRTPTSPNFFLNSFETPKPESRFHDSYSPWTPAFAASPAFKTPTRVNTNAVANESQTQVDPADSTLTENLGVETPQNRSNAASQTHLQPPPGKSTKQSKASPSLDGSLGRRVKSPTHQSASKTVENKTSSETVSSARSMQTPPPTSTTSSRRTAQEVQIARAMQENAPSREDKMSLQDISQIGNANALATQIDESPIHFPNLQFSPDGFTFPVSGPATAPVYPQHKLFWDPEQSGDTMALDLPMDDAFPSMGLGLQRTLQPFVSDHHSLQGPQSVSETIAAMSSASTGFSMSDLTLPKHSIALSQTNLSSSTAIMTQGSSRGRHAGTVVDPSLLFSSPSRPPRSASQRIQDDTLKPYATQLHDAQVEKELKVKRPKRKRGAEVDSPAVKAATQALRGAEEQDSQNSSDGAISSTFGGHIRSQSQHERHARRRHSKASPNRRSSRLVLDDERPGSRNSKRASITFSIDASGRASAQTSFVDGLAPARPSSRMDVDIDSESSESSPSSSNEEIVFSQPSSFAYPVDRQKKIRSSRSHHSSRLHSQKSSYTSTLGSSSAVTGPSGSDSKRRYANMKLSTEAPPVRFQNTDSFIMGALNPDESEAETVVETEGEKGNAQAELKKVLQRRSSQKMTALPSGSGYRQNTLDNRSVQSTGAFTNIFPNLTPGRFPRPDPNKNISPTTITDPGARTPSTGQQSSGSNGTTRCICSHTESDGHLMIQW